VEGLLIVFSCLFINQIGFFGPLNVKPLCLKKLGNITKNMQLNCD
jgi:hypothetical protein